VSRITQGKIRLRSERLDLLRLVRDAAEDGRSVVDEAGLSLVLDLPDESTWVEGDPTRLAQVVGNLLTNASKFTHPGGRVTVRLALAGTEGSHHGDTESTERKARRNEPQMNTDEHE
jgi:signal transduction histidine kinase